MQVVKKSDKIVSHVVLGLGSVIMLYPFVFVLLGTFASIEGFYEVKFLPIPKSISYLFENIAKIMKREEVGPSILLTLGRFLWYAFFVTGSSILGGYVFSKVNFRFKKAAFYILMSSMMIPGVALLIPQYMLLTGFPLVGGNNILGKGGTGFRDNEAVLFVTGLFSAYNIFLVKQSLEGIGNEFKEAAEIDGAGFLRIVFMFYMPMLKPVIAVMIIQLFIGQWNDYLFPLLFTNSGDIVKPIGLVSVRIQSDYLYQSSGGGLMNYPLVMAMALLMMIPPVAVYVAFQRYFVEGLTVGGVK